MNQRFIGQRSGVFRLAACASLVASIAGFGRAAADDAANVGPYVSETTIAVLKIDVARLGLPDFGDDLKSQSPAFQKAYGQWSAQSKPLLDLLRSSAGGQPIYATASLPISKSHLPVFIAHKAAGDAQSSGLLALLPGAQPSQASVRGEWTVLSPVPGADVLRLLEMSPAAPRPELASAWQAVEGFPIQLAILPPAYLRTTVRELMPRLPQQLGGGPTVHFTDGVIWVAIGVDPAAMRVELVVQSASERAAGELAAYLPTLLAAVRPAMNAAALQNAIPPETIDALQRLIAPKVEGDQVIVRLDGKEQIGETLKLWASIAGAVSEQWRERTDTDRLRQIVIAMHNHHDVYLSFPPEKKFRDEKGASKLSWRVHLLPFLEQLPLYNEFHLDEPWDSPHNKPLIERMPDVFKGGAEGVAPGHTTFLAPVGDGTIFGGPKPVKFQDVVDGTSNTAVVVQVKPELAVPWTAPDDYAFDPKDPGKGLHVAPDGRFLAAMADGSASSFRADVAAELLLNLFRMNDGNPVDMQAIR